MASYVVSSLFHSDSHASLPLTAVHWSRQSDRLIAWRHHDLLPGRSSPLLTECSRPCYSWYPWTSKPVWSLDIYTKYPPPTPARKLFQHSNVTSSTWHWASTNLLMLESQGDEEIILGLSNAYKSIYCVGMWVNT